MKDNSNIEGRSVTSRNELIDLLVDIKAVEVMARLNYESDIITFKNFIITDTIKKIKKDEDKHIDMLEALIKMLRERA
jgi:bacterioferritin (cytochrome b1)